MASQYWQDFTNGGYDEHFFGEKNYAMRRLLQRYSG